MKLLTATVMADEGAKLEFSEEWASCFFSLRHREQFGFTFHSIITIFLAISDCEFD